MIIKTKCTTLFLNLVLKICKKQIKLCFDDWHNNEYMKICYWNLREKFLCGQKDFTKEMWDEIEKAFGQQ